MRSPCESIRFGSEASPFNRRGSANIALWLSIWGIVVSLGCIYVALDARNVAKDSERRLERTAEQLQESRETIVTLENSMTETLRLSEQRIEELTFEVRRNTSRLRTNSAQLVSTREVASTLIDNLASQKKAITELASRITATPEGVQVERARPSPPDPAPSSTPPATTGEPQRQASPPVTTAPDTYTVQSGDTLVDIARRKNLSVPDLLDANPDIDPNLIRVGQKLNLPD